MLQLSLLKILTASIVAMFVKNQRLMDHLNFLINALQNSDRRHKPLLSDVLVCVSAIWANASDDLQALSSITPAAAAQSSYDSSLSRALSTNVITNESRRYFPALVDH